MANGLGFQSPGQGFAQGLNIASTLAGLQQRKTLYDQKLGLIEEQRLREKGEDDATKAYSAALTNTLEAGENPLNLLAQWPNKKKELGEIYQIQQDTKGTDTKRVTGNLVNALDRGDSAGIESILTGNQELFNNIGDKSFTVDSFRNVYQQDPDLARKMAVGTFMASGGKRSDLAGAKPDKLTAYQKAQIDLKKSEQEQKMLESKLKQETSELKKEEIQQNIDIKEQDKLKAQREAYNQSSDAIEAIDNNLSAVNRVLDHPGRESATGFTGAFPTFPGSEAAGFEAQLETLKSQSFLGAVQQMKGLGALSEKEGDKLASSIGALSLTMPEDEFQKELERIKKTLEKAKSKMKARAPKPPPGTGQDFKSLWGE